MERMNKIYNMVLQSSTKGLRAVEIANKIGIHKTVIYRDLNSLYLMGKVESDQGIWRAKTGEQKIKPLEKEIVIELPLPKRQWQQEVLLEHTVQTFGAENEPDNIFKISLDKLKETRTIRIKGKNVDDLELEKLAELIKQANERSSKLNLKGIFKKLKKSQPASDQSSF